MCGSLLERFAAEALEPCRFGHFYVVEQGGHYEVRVDGRAKHVVACAKLDQARLIARNLDRFYRGNLED